MVLAQFEFAIGEDLRDYPLNLAQRRFVGPVLPKLAQQAR